ncbi:MAG: hypothetical protein MJ092_02400 [Lachnospiraceae bacterium]|nr:hypothetical protein [Lachnospiraceae bacterium]
MKKKCFCLLICIAMLLAIMPLQVFASTTVTTADALATAFATGGEIVLGDDITMVDQPLVVANGSTVNLDLNGHILSGYYTNSGSSAIITNNGEFILNDNAGGGKNTMYATDPSGATIPSYASNAISNCGVMTMNGGTIENTTVNGYAAYCIDNQSNVRDAELVINGGTIINSYTDCIRQACIGTKANRVTINGGSILSDDSYNRAIWIHIFGNNVPSDISLCVNGGEFVGGIGTYSFASGTNGFFSADQSEHTIIAIHDGSTPFLQAYFLGDATVTISGGEFLYCDLSFSGNVDPDLEVTGGEFFDECYAWGVDDSFISGGIFHADPDSYGESYLPFLQLMDGYTVCEIEEDVYEVHGAWSEIAEKAPTCTEAGNDHYFECSTCKNKYEEDFALIYEWDEDTEEITKSILDIEPLTDVEIPALGHDLTGKHGVWVHDDATEKDNSQHMRSCARNCGYTEHENCSFKETERIEPTPQKDGKIVYTCSVCGYSYEEPLHVAVPTGDNNNMFLWLTLLFISGSVAVGTIGYVKKKS